MAARKQAVKQDSPEIGGEDAPHLARCFTCPYCRNRTLIQAMTHFGMRLVCTECGYSGPPEPMEEFVS